jgi:hypothetical protein
MKREAASLTSSSTTADQAIANKVVPLLYQYWKAPTEILSPRVRFLASHDWHEV